MKNFIKLIEEKKYLEVISDLNKELSNSFDLSNDEHRKQFIYLNYLKDKVYFNLVENVNAQYFNEEKLRGINTDQNSDISVAAIKKGGEK